MKRDRRESLIMTTIIMVSLLILGYAYLTATLNVKGDSTILESSWDIHWENVVVTSGSVSGEQVTQAATITNNQTTVSYRIKLREPGDFYEFTVDAVNDGSMDGMISVLSSTVNNTPISNLPSYLTYSVTYFDDIAITQNQILPSRSADTYKVRIEYKENIQPSDLPSSQVSLALTFGVTYVQADNNGIDVRTYSYFNGYEGEAKMGVRLPSRIPLFPRYEQVLAASGKNLFIKIGLQNHVVIEEALGINNKGTIYYLYPGGATYLGPGQGYGQQGYADDSPYYTANIATLDAIFGSSSCSEWTGSGMRYNCSKSGLSATVYANGEISFYLSSTENCKISSSGAQCCGCASKSG